MKPHPRIRKTVKWGGAAVTVLLVAAWVGSVPIDIEWTRPGRMIYHFELGSFVVQRSEVDNRPFFQGLHWSRHPRPYLRLWWHSWIFPTYWVVSIPLWPFILAALGTTVAAWRLDVLARRRQYTHCPKCNYDRTGLAPGAVCPECGSKPQHTTNSTQHT